MLRDLGADHDVIEKPFIKSKSSKQENWRYIKGEAKLKVEQNKAGVKNPGNQKGKQIKNARLNR